VARPPATTRHEEDRGTARITSGSEGFSRGARRNRKGIAEHRTRNANRFTVRSRVSGQQDDALDPGVTLLERDPSLYTLAIAKCHLGLDAYHRPGPVDHCIPGALISGNWNGHLGLNGQPRVKHRSELVEERPMRGVPQGRPTWEELDRQIEPHRQRKARENARRDPWRLTPFDPPDLSPGNRARGGNCLLAQPGGEAGASKLLSGFPEKSVGLSPDTCHPSIDCGHSPMMPADA
jgi:hypothetical protein